MQMMRQYVAEISGPPMDRIDIHMGVSEVNVTELSNPHQAEPSATVRERVVRGRRNQIQRIIGDLHAETRRRGGDWGFRLSLRLRGAA